MKNSKKSAQSLIEYGLILALVAIIALTVLTKFGKSITDAGARTDSTINSASAGANDAYCAKINGTGSTWDGTTCTAGS